MSHAASRIEPEEEILLFYFRSVAIGMYDRMEIEASLLNIGCSVDDRAPTDFRKGYRSRELWTSIC